MFVILYKTSRARLEFVFLTRLSNNMDGLMDDNLPVYRVIHQTIYVYNANRGILINELSRTEEVTSLQQEECQRIENLFAMECQDMMQQIEQQSQQLQEKDEELTEAHNAINGLKEHYMSSKWEINELKTKLRKYKHKLTKERAYREIPLQATELEEQDVCHEEQAPDLRTSTSIDGHPIDYGTSVDGNPIDYATPIDVHGLLRKMSCSYIIFIIERVSINRELLYISISLRGIN